VKSRKDLRIQFSAACFASAAGLHTQIADIAGRQQLALECKRIAESVYSPAIAGFIFELAQSRGRLQQFRELVLMGLEIDMVRRLIMHKVYYSPHQIASLLRVPDVSKVTFGLRQGRFNLRRWVTFRIRYVASKVRYALTGKG